jgi:hypothetical protein
VFIKPRKLTLFGGFKGTMKVHLDMEIVARCPEILRQILDTQPSHPQARVLIMDQQILRVSEFLYSDKIHY